MELCMSAAQIGSRCLADPIRAVSYRNAIVSYVSVPTVWSPQLWRHGPAEQRALPALGPKETTVDLNPRLERVLDRLMAWGMG